MPTATPADSAQCHHRYKSDEARRCRYPEFFAGLRALVGRGEEPRIPVDGSLELPIDSEHLCLFHSHDPVWKAANDFVSRFRQFVQLVHWNLEFHPSRLLQEDRIDCRGFVFAKAKDASVIDLSRLSTAHKLDLVEAVFLHAADFQGSEFTGSAYFERAHFLSYAHFIDCQFHNNAYFEEAIFKDYAVFRNTQFDGVTSFDRTHFGSDATSYFERLRIGKQLVFKGTLEKKLFPGPWVFTLSDEKQSGGVSFQNVALNRLDRPSQESLKALEKKGVAQILSGCERYRVSRELLVPYRRKYEALVSDIMQAFTEIFKWEGTLQITMGVEMEYLEDNMLIRYFSDADVTQDQFAAALQQAVPLFFRFLANPEQCLTVPISLGQWDVFRRLKSAQLGLAAHIAFDKEWDIRNTGELLGAQPGPLEPETLLMLHEHLNQTIISVASNAHVIFNLTGGGDLNQSHQIMGDHNEQHISGGIFYGTVANVMRKCESIIQNAARGEQQKLMEILRGQIAEIVGGPEDEKSQLKKLAAQRLQELLEGVASGAPDRAWYSISAKGLLEAAKFVKEFSADITGTLTNLGMLFWPDFKL